MFVICELNEQCSAGQGRAGGAVQSHAKTWMYHIFVRLLGCTPTLVVCLATRNCEVIPEGSYT